MALGIVKKGKLVVALIGLVWTFRAEQDA